MDENIIFVLSSTEHEIYPDLIDVQITVFNVDKNLIILSIAVALLYVFYS